MTVAISGLASFWKYLFIFSVDRDEELPHREEKDRAVSSNEANGDHNSIKIIGQEA